jgi:hypothetical protein
MLAGQSHSLISTRARRNTKIHGNFNANFPDENASDVQNRLTLWSTAFRRVMDFWWDESPIAGAMDPRAFEQARQAVIDRVQSQNSVVAIYQTVLSYDLEAGVLLPGEGGVESGKTGLIRAPVMTPVVGVFPYPEVSARIAPTFDTSSIFRRPASNSVTRPLLKRLLARERNFSSNSASVIGFCQWQR